MSIIEELEKRIEDRAKVFLEQAESRVGGLACQKAIEIRTAIDDAGLKGTIAEHLRAKAVKSFVATLERPSLQLEPDILKEIQRSICKHTVMAGYDPLRQLTLDKI